MQGPAIGATLLAEGFEFGRAVGVRVQEFGGFECAVGVKVQQLGVYPKPLGRRLGFRSLWLTSLPYKP